MIICQHVCVCVSCVSFQGFRSNVDEVSIQRSYIWWRKGAMQGMWGLIEEMW